MRLSTVPTDREEFTRWLRSTLPRLLREDPSFYSEVVGLLVQALGSRSDFDRLLEESKALREQAERALQESRMRFEAAERRFEELVERLKAGDHRFEEMGRRLDEMGGRQDEMLQRLKENDARFEETFQRLRENDRRFEEMGRRLDEMGRRQDEMLQRLKENDARFQETFQRLRENDRRFEEMFRRLEATERHVTRLELGLGSLGIRVGRGLEAVIRDVIADFSGIGDLEARKLVLTDTAGEVYQPGAEVEIDAYVYNGHRFLVEVKSYAKPVDASAFARKASFAERELGITAEKVLIALAVAPGTRERASKLGIRLITYGRR